MSHHFQIWVHKIKDEKHKEEWFLLQHDSKVSENNISTEEEVHTNPTESVVAVVIFIRN